MGRGNNDGLEFLSRPRSGGRYISWPQLDYDDEENGWRDTGEGGLWATIVVPSDEEPAPRDEFDREHFLSIPDVIVGAASRSGQVAYGEAVLRDIWPLADAALQDMDAWNDPAKRHWGWSRPLLAVAELEFNPHAFVRGDGGDSFLVTYERLNDNGKQLYDALEAEHGREPLIITFLDT